MPAVDRSIHAMRARVASWRAAGSTIALVPTMGALHTGHLALVEEARKRAQHVVVSIFVNPTQFAPTEDLDSYPRQETADLEKLSALGVDAVFAPSAAEMYPSAFASAVSVNGPAMDLESVSRPHFFGGVATVVAKLFNAVTPDIAIFGEKDYQQLLVIRRMVADLNFPIEIIGIPTVREADGLALSSRNAYLSAEERGIAPLLHRTLQETAAAIRGGQGADKAVDTSRETLGNAGFRVDYIQVRNAETLAPVQNVNEPMRILAAAWLGRTRLIDNIPV